MHISNVHNIIIIMKLKNDAIKIFNRAYALYSEMSLELCISLHSSNIYLECS